MTTDPETVADRLDDGRDADDGSDANPERRPTGDAMAASLLYDTGDLVDDDRDTHGDAVENQQHIARAWTWYLAGQGALEDDAAIHGDDVAAMMQLLKLSRHAVGGRDMDHLRDCAGYAAIGGACMVDRGAADLSEIERGAYEGAHLDADEGGEDDEEPRRPNATVRDPDDVLDGVSDE
jgi:hypothetical protein